MVGCPGWSFDVVDPADFKASPPKFGFEFCCCNAGSRNGLGVAVVVETLGILDDVDPLLLLVPELALLADGVVGRVGGFAVAFRGVAGSTGTLETLVSDPTDDTVDTTRVRDLDRGLAMPDLNDVGAADVGVFERNTPAPNALTPPLSESPLPCLLPLAPSIDDGALNRWICVSSSDETNESRGVGGNGRLPPLLLAGEVDRRALMLRDVADDRVLLEKTGDEPRPEPVPEEPDVEEFDKRAEVLD